MNRKESPGILRGAKNILIKATLNILDSRDKII
jgi:hypothetical protein